MLTPRDIQELSYVDFVGLINQWNVLPGSFDTLNRWKVFSQLDSKSRLLEIACTTGFSSRELSILSGCSGDAIDLSSASIEKAKENKRKYAPDSNIQYHSGDALEFNPGTIYTHIAIGASLKFFPDPTKMVRHCTDLLEDGGYLLASPFFIHTAIPPDLINEARSVFGITITTESYKEVMALYRDFEVVYEERKNLIPETPAELEHYCSSTITRFCEDVPSISPEVRKAAYDRLMQIKVMSNKLRSHQGYTVLVLRYRKILFGKRFVELF